MKQSQLNELLRHITNIVLNEFMNSVSSAPSNDSKSGDSNNPSLSTSPTDAMTDAEKKRHDRDVEHNRQKDLKAKEQELKTAKKEMDFQRQKVDQTKRFSIPTINRDIQQLKGAKLSEEKITKKK